MEANTTGLIWWTVLGDWGCWRGDRWFFLVGYRFGGLCWVIGGAGGVTGGSFWSDIDLVDCASATG